ncbi:MAG: hypothetical protein HYS81_03640 [Candidatus Aenigmatarchaeota archaeon]|nr:MAG: hypothetical protein HYS81_03640 [Candidatus Aenigmarchaeota archaeon]
MKARTLAKIEGIVRPVISDVMSPENLIRFYSKGRRDFLEFLGDDRPESSYVPPESLKRTMWGLTFQGPLMNAAGMFKNGERKYYEASARQGAGAWLAGTATALPREGNEVMSIAFPFVPYARSRAASNYLGLPNDGDATISRRLSTIGKLAGCPAGVSVMGAPELEGDGKLWALVSGMRYYEAAGVDFIEMNESCPNTGRRPQEDGLAERLSYVRDNFLASRKRRLPAIAKFSNDTKVEQVPGLMDLLFDTGFDGANFGNTSTDYKNLEYSINKRERELFNYFTKKFGGGVSGAPLKIRSFGLAAAAVKHVKENGPEREFHVWRTGGINGLSDLAASDMIGVSMNQWYTGYFERFAKHGHRVYAELYERMSAKE